MLIRRYNPERDPEAVLRIWREIGWLPPEDQKADPLLREWWSESHTLVAELAGQPECLVVGALGELRYLQETLPLGAVLAVSTSHVARRQGLAARLTARLVADLAEQGAAVCGLGIFDQGYYDRLGFGTGSYEHLVRVDPTHLIAPQRPRPAERISAEQYEEIHQARRQRRAGHGAVRFDSALLTRLQLSDPHEGFGLGYREGPGGELTHLLWAHPENRESGPWHLKLIFRNREQFRELMALLAGMGDQVHLVQMREPPGMQMQDLMHRPFKTEALTEGGKYPSHIRATAYWQMRLCDLPGALARTSLPGPAVSFGLILHDPIADLLEEGGWRGIGGEYTVTLGPESAAETGRDPALPVLRASVGAFTRLWLGVQPARGLAMTDDLEGPEELLEELETTLRLPQPHPDWDF